MKFKYTRFIIIGAVLLAMMGALIFQLGMLTLNQGDTLSQKAADESSREIVLKGTRGRIMDRNGIVLAYSATCYNVEFLRNGDNRTDYDNTMYTDALIKAIKIIEDGGGEIINTSYIQMNDDGELYYDWGVKSESGIKARYKNFCDAMSFKIKDADKDDMSKWKSAEDAYLELRAAWDIPEEMTFADAVKIISIRQEVNLNNYRAYEPVTIAYDVSMEVVAQIEMMKDELPGLQTSQSNTRVYPYGESAAHIVGYVQRTVTKEMKEESGYSYSDYVGVAGIEYSMEKYLTGATTEHQGRRVIEVNRNGSETRELEYVSPTDGCDVILTMDYPMQKTCEQALSSLIAQLYEYETGLIESNPEKYGEPGESNGIKKAETGSITVLNANTGQILACASYPSYDPNWFIKGLSTEQSEYLFGKEGEKNSAASRTTPMRNKAISAKLAPGSVFKMVTGMAGLMEGAVGLHETIDDMSPYILYDEDGKPIEKNAPSCHAANPRQDHPQQDIVKAITNSCNYYFYEVANRLGVEKVAKWGEEFGLTTKTGIELPGEAVGVIGGQKVLYDNTLSIDEQKVSLPNYVYRVIKDRLHDYLALCGKEASEDDIAKCALKLMQLQDGSLDGKGGEVRRIMSETIGIPEGISRVQPWVSEIMSALNEIQWKATLTIRTGIGQAVLSVTPVGVARYVAAIANGGTVYDVHIVSQIVDSDGRIVETIEPSVYNQISAPDEYWQAIREGMKGVVSPEDRGTAAKKWSEAFKAKGYHEMIIGKTGSAQTGNNPIDIENTSWFVVCAPRDNPEIVVVVCIPSGYSGSSSVTAVEDIITYYFDKQLAKAPENLNDVNTLIQ